MADDERPIARLLKRTRDALARDVSFGSKSVVTCSQRFAFAKFRDLFPTCFFTPFTFPGNKYRRFYCLEIGIVMSVPFLAIKIPAQGGFFAGV